MTARRMLVSGIALACLLGMWIAPSAQAAFGIKNVSVTALNRDGSVDVLAGSHPYEYVVRFALNANSAGEVEGLLQTVNAELPVGLIGNPRAVPECTGIDFEGLLPHCPANTQIGHVEVKGEGIPVAEAAIYNLVPSVGVPATIGTSIFETNSFQEASLRPTDYGVDVFVPSLPTNRFAIQSIVERIWGVPSDSGHDAQRECKNADGNIFHGCTVEPSKSPSAFLTLPTSCGGPLRTTVKVTSVEEPFVTRATTLESTNGNGTPVGLGGCESLPFRPKIGVQSETNAAESPTGLDVDIEVPQTDDGNQAATAHLRAATVALPKGLELNPSTADGLAACALTGPEGINLPGSGPAEGEPANCPAASKVGTVEIDTPLLDHPVRGGVYIAQQGNNPFHSLLALYIAVNDPVSGVVVKLAGKVDPDPSTGQLTATFANNPQLPFEDLHVDFPGGARAPLTTPATCGSYAIRSELTPWSSPEGKTAEPSASIDVSGGAAGGACPATEGAAPNKPSFEAGTVSPLAGIYTPFVMRLSRENGSQRFGSLNVNLPPGVAAKFAGVQECSDAQIAQARARSNPGEGALEITQPSCPKGSELGTVTVGAGSGAPLYVQGHAYLAGPYKGAPFSVAIITPAVAGPFDLGTVAVRAALYVNETTAQGTIKSDPFPTILQGIPLDIRSVAVNISRQSFTLNPTSCEVKAISAEAVSTTGQAANLQNRFQVGGCKGLGFKPNLTLALRGGTRRNQHPALKSVITYPKGEYSNIAKATVILPVSEFIDQAHIGNPCTRPVFAEEKCPKISILGKAKAWTPLLDKPEEGNVYFRSNGGERELPDLVVALKGQVPLTLVGFVDSQHHKGSEVSRLRTTFATVPDAPVSKFVLELKGGKEGLLVNSGNLCKVPNKAIVKLSAQNGRVYNTEPPVANGCGAKKSQAKKSQKRHRLLGLVAAW